MKTTLCRLAHTSVWYALLFLGTSCWAGYLDEWTLRTNLPLKRIIFAGGQFVGVGPDGRVLTSRDGAVWAAQNSRTNAYLNGIAHRPSPSLFVAVGERAILYSVDATNWTATSSPWLLQDVTFGATSFVIATAQQSTSDPNILWGGGMGSWSTRTFSTDIVTFQRVIYANGRYVAVGGITTGIWTSTNLVSWSNSVSGSQHFRGVAFGNGRFVAAGMEGSPWVSTNNGMTWNRFYVDPGTNHFANDNYFVAEGVTFGDGRFAIFRGWLSNMFWSVNGSNWVKRPVPMGSQLEAGAFGQGTLVAVGPAGIYQSGSYAPELTASQSGLNQPVQVSFLAETGRTYGIEASTNFAQWAEVYRTTNETAQVEYFDWTATNGHRRFYRAVTP